MKKRLLLLGLAPLAAAFLGTAQQDIWILIDGGRPAYAFALPAFIAENEPAKSTAEEARRIFEADIRYTRIFQLLPTTYYSYIRPLDPKNIFYKDWVSIQASLLFVGVLGESPAGELTFEGRLLDVKSERQIVGRRYQAGKGDLRYMMHRMADEIMKAFGEKPIFTSKIAFVSNRDGNNEIYFMDYDGARQERFTFNTVRDYMPAFAPEGRHIAYTSYRGLQAGLYLDDIYESRRTTIAVKGTNYAPAFTADGKKLAFSSSMDGNAEIYVAEVEYNPTRIGRIRRLTFNPAVDTAPSWSPNGREIVFTSDRGGTPQIYIMDAEGANPRRISFGSNHHDAPAWSPNGDKIAYVARVDSVFDIYLYHVQSGQVRKLTESNARNESPAWSPDGRHLVFTSNMRGGLQIFAVDADGQNLRQLTTQGENKLPDWSN
ncbi:MAG: Tol-Pal system beta propeller repeat protein TolB [Candidatus Aminicenantes bacterium]|nr:Tol-Pal system beta propeller repeat protein TolB [Candidatus Aminicenantes bacterium]